MRTIRIYQAGHYETGDSFLLSEDAGQHVGVVLRMQVGDELTLFRGDNQEFSAVISAVHKKKVEVSISAGQVVDRESPRRIHLAQAISKGERMELVVQKAVELGVASITPLITERCAVKRQDERMEKKNQQWQAIAVAACEQSGRNIVPRIHPAQSLDAFLASERPTQNFILYPKAGKSWRDYAWTESDIGLVIGPEGGLSTDEINRLLALDYAPLSLGPRVLRTETAAIAALSVLQAVCGDL
ncbi:16S rRNA (uracil(1498)-N(3))-methyltransferase [Legionella sp. CNM-4043-24]|uniref:16S rRNA (uracil(1498)-N(3))-methyltransferase n=1 Tax=Legionella sp. CNM-4043-24 TaxID=3421646 RepID=UPI00403A8B89